MYTKTERDDRMLRNRPMAKSVTLGQAFSSPMPMPFRDDGLPDWDAPTLGSFVSFTLENGPLKGRVVVLKRQQNGMYVIAEDDAHSRNTANRDIDKEKLRKEEEHDNPGHQFGVSHQSEATQDDLHQLHELAESTMVSKSAAWTRKEGKNPRGGLNARGRASAKAEGHNLKPPVRAGTSLTDLKRRYSFLSRMGNMPGPERDENGKPTRLLLSLQAWGASSKSDAHAKAAMLKRRIARMEGTTSKGLFGQTALIVPANNQSAGLPQDGGDGSRRRPPQKFAQRGHEDDRKSDKKHIFKGAGTMRYMGKGPMPPVGMPTSREGGRGGMERRPDDPDVIARNRAILEGSGANINPDAAIAALARRNRAANLNENAETPEQRAMRIQKLKQQVAAGEYQVDPRRLGDAIIASGGNDNSDDSIRQRNFARRRERTSGDAQKSFQYEKNLMFPVQKGRSMSRNSYWKALNAERAYSRRLFEKSYENMLDVERMAYRGTGLNARQVENRLLKSIGIAPIYKALPPGMRPPTRGMGQANGAETIREDAMGALREERKNRLMPQYIYQDPPTRDGGWGDYGIESPGIRQSSGQRVPDFLVPSRGGRELRPEDPDVKARNEWIMSGARPQSRKGKEPQLRENRRSIPHHMADQIPERFLPNESRGEDAAVKAFRYSYRQFMKNMKPPTAGMGMANGARYIPQNREDYLEERANQILNNGNSLLDDVPTNEDEGRNFGVRGPRGGVPYSKVPSRGGREIRASDPDVQRRNQWVMSDNKQGPEPELYQGDRRAIPHRRLGEIPAPFRPAESGGGWDSPDWQNFVAHQQRKQAQKSMRSRELEAFRRSYQQFMKRTKKLI